MFLYDFFHVKCHAAAEARRTRNLQVTRLVFCLNFPAFFDNIFSYAILVAAAAACSDSEQAALEEERLQLQQVLETITSSEL